MSTPSRSSRPSTSRATSSRQRSERIPGRAATGAARGASNPASVSVSGHRLPLSNLDKLLYPAAPFTKGQVIDYFARIAPAMLPHIRDHPLSLVRYPSGVNAPHFFQKNCPSHKPAWLKTEPLPGNPGTSLCTADSPAALVWLANLAALEIHPYLWTRGQPDRPALIVFDLDPGPGVTILDCARIALRLRRLLFGLGLQSFPKTSGKKGLHLSIPLNTPATFEETKPFARAIAQILEQESPHAITTTMTKSLRAGKVFIDWSQNDRSKTTVAAYSLRGSDRPTVSTPLAWSELSAAIRSSDPDALAFDAPAVLRRLARRRDPAHEVPTLRQRLPAAARSPSA